MTVGRALREQVEARAGGRCEYCGIRQTDEPFLRFHVEHVVARQHGCATDAVNLALACHHCNLHKGPNLSGVDPAGGAVVRLFEPRVDVHEKHFERRPDGTVVGLTPAGRATVATLAMNASGRVELRRTTSREA